VYVEVGQSVKAGEKLFEYDTEDIKIKIDQENLEVEKMQNSISNSRKQIDTINAEKAANPGGDHASFNIDIQTLENDIKQTEYSIKSKKTEIDRLKKSLKNVVITSEIDGIVQTIKDSENNDDQSGMMMDGGQTQDDSYITIMQTGEYKVKGVINEQNMWSLNTGDRVKIHSRIDENISWGGSIESIDTSNPESNNNNSFYMMNGDDSMNRSSKYPFYIVLDSKEGLMLGQHVYIEKDVGQENERQGLWLSNYYVIEENGEYFVWASNKNEKLEKRKIKIGEKNEEIGEYQILEGLTAEDYIAVPTEELEEGKKVTKYDVLTDIPVNIEGEVPNMDVIVEGDGEISVPEESTTTDELTPMQPTEEVTKEVNL
jgi:HlyD family secretion protein